METHSLAGLTIATRLIEIGRQFHSRGWVLGTSGNFSAVVAEDPLRIAITVSGADKGALSHRDIIEIDGNCQVVSGVGRPSDEARLHVAVVKNRGAKAVLHTHSVWGTMLSQIWFAKGGLSIEGYEMLKGLGGIRTHEHREWLPIIENSQDMSELASEVTSTLERNPEVHAFMLRRHGLYTWGADLAEANRHVEILEFLLEVTARTGGLGGSSYGDRPST